MKKVIVCIMILALALGLTSCMGGGNNVNTFTISDSMKITLDGDFKYYDPIEQIGTYECVIDSSEAKIIVLKAEVYDDIDLGMNEDLEAPNQSLYNYAKEISGRLGLPNNVVYDKTTGLIYAEDTQTIIVTEVRGVYYVFYEEGAGLIWMVGMYCTPDNYNTMKPKFDKWAASVEFCD